MNYSSRVPSSARDETDAKLKIFLDRDLVKSASLGGRPAKANNEMGGNGNTAKEMLAVVNAVVVIVAMAHPDFVELPLSLGSERLFARTGWSILVRQAG